MLHQSDFPFFIFKNVVSLKSAFPVFLAYHHMEYLAESTTQVAYFIHRSVLKE